jgi:adenine-specific DNA-methyltransferase
MRRDSRSGAELADSHIAVRGSRGIQQSFPFPVLVPRPAPLEPKGVVYTKRWVVELLLDLAGYTANANLVDAVAVEPAAGEGAFLVAMIARLTDSCRRLGRPIADCRNSLIAYELDEGSAERARTLAAELLSRQGVDAPTAEGLAKSWLRTGDYLFDSMTVEADFVIGNPPYVRLEEIPVETALLYRDAYPTMYGRADLYVAFFEAGLRQLKHGGACAFICADRWMRNQYGAELRKLITSEFAVDVVIEMHNADAFQDEVDAYPAITVIRRQKQGRTIVASAGPEVECVPSGTLAATLLKNSIGKRAAMPAGLHAARVDSWFKGGDPWPCQSPDQLALLRRLEEEFLPLETNARVGIGVATGNDKVFVTNDAHLVEPSRLLKLAMAKDISSGAVQWSGHYLVDPWNSEGLVSLDRYPRLQAYFEKHGAALKKRHTAIKSGHAWYKTIDRVTHALTEKPKLYIADIKNILDPVLDSGETYPHHNLYFIQSDVWNLEVLGGLLISAIGQFFVASYGVRMRGGYFRFQAQYLRRIRLPDPKTLLKAQANELIKAFRSRDRSLATETALKIYGIEQLEMESAIGH